MKKITLFLMTLCISIVVMAQNSGICGDNLKWSYNTTNSTLTISGSGAMSNFNHNSIPWKNVTSKITTINLPNGITTIGDFAFFDCCYLTSITIPDGVTSIGVAAFYDCLSIKSITIPNSVTTIEKTAFTSCKSITSITIPNSVINIGAGAFTECNSLSTINVESDNKNFISIDGVLINNAENKLLCYPEGIKGSTYSIPDNVTSIGELAFKGCTTLTTITIPDGVTTIESGAFRDCQSLSSINIPISVKKIGKGAIGGCNSLKSISIPNNVAKIEDMTSEDYSFM